MKPRIIFLHGNQSSHWSYGWASWLKQELEQRGYPTFFETFPDSVIARAEYWLPFLEQHIHAGEHDVLVGWSSGAVAAMRYAERHQILGSVLISPCYTDLGSDLERQSGYYDQPWQWEQIKQHQSQITLIHSDNDPCIPQSEFDVIAAKLQPKRIIVPRQGHFTEITQFPEVLNTILETYPS